MQKRVVATVVALSALAGPVSAQDTGEETISEITVSGKRVANERPAGSYAAPVTRLRFDPLTETQSRGLAEGQSDVTVRGGVFENTGFQLGAVTIMDPQTGHYAAELPVDPELLTAPAIYKGIDNAVTGFNSAIATVSYGIRSVRDGGLVALGAGTDDLNYQYLRVARTTELASGNNMGSALSLARSDGDGTVADGDHRFHRANLHLQYSDAASQTDLLASYQDKFYGWPGAYTGFATLPETDDTQTTLLVASHRRQWIDGWWETGAFFRRLVDDYDFDRRTSESGTPGSFEHETRVFGVGLQGLASTGVVAWRFGIQFTADELVRSTDLTNGDFDDRRYATLTLVPSMEFDLDGDRTLTVRAGATADYSNRDSNKLLPLFGLTLGRTTAGGHTDISVEFAETSQLPGYTALKSNPSGLFGGNPDLGRERARQVAVSAAHDAGDWRGRISMFSRKDDDLVDWTYAIGSPLARQANPVDIDVLGFEAFFSRQWPTLDLAAGYTWLDKDEDYESALVDASFYALNFARHRATLALRYQFAGGLDLGIDTEYRRQEDNPLRVGDDSAFLASVSLSWNGNGGVGAAIVVDNLTDSEYQPFPGTPAAGRQVSLRVSYGW